MCKNTKLLMLFLVSILLSAPAAAALKKKDKLANGKGEITGDEHAVLWRRPTDIGARNLFYGPGGKAHQPHGTFTFEKEDLDGSNPKFVVRDQDGVKWKVKLGVEAKPETVASRLVWSAGYFTNEDYFLADLHVKNMPAHLQRRSAGKFIQPGGSMHDVRLKRYLKGEKKIGNWEWRDDPFRDTREYNGLRVMMALINNWDLKDENNAIYEDKRPGEREGPERIYMVSDLGASFGTSGLVRTHEQGKGNLESYLRSKFIKTIGPGYVDFETPHRPAFIVLFNPHEYCSRVDMEWIGKHIPREDAKWIGRMLAQLSPKQISDSFRAAGYTPLEVKGFSGEVKSRIAQLASL
jgi:hypothetical protein